MLLKGESDREFLVLLFIILLAGAGLAAGMNGKSITDVIRTDSGSTTNTPPGTPNSDTLDGPAGDSSNEIVNVNLTFDKGVTWLPLETWEMKSGFNWRGIESDLKDMQQANITWARIFAATDDAVNTRLFKLMHTYKIRPVVVITEQNTKPAGGFWERLSKRSNLKDFAEKYKSDVRFFEIGNEPNNPKYWNIPATTNSKDAYEAGVTSYVTHLKDSYNAVKAGNSKAYIILGGLSDDNITYWLDIFMNQEGYNYIDIMSYHPSGKTPEEMVQKTTAVKAHIASVAEFGVKPFWITGFGYTADKHESTQNTVLDETTKAKHLTNTFVGLRSLRIYGPIFWYVFAEPEENKAGYGLLLKNHTTMTTTYLPAYENIKNLP